ncbi:MAG: nucleotidyl transferase AbiEii/AbiGii toxin family protein [Syntrophorhabdus aromaticivorans]|uniref:Nucleotidyl transferase AbiEii/AbiGii toxin family protein n=1 Tax=Syntrophorhabdus aromaticivorans TaxID=328301 RepID=A0A971M7F9_9BACT|nr:nucleotidyl transferase AbiEii/AbiGii toxin family protein [Syntrophorhabdus aromaticivorans]
MSVQMIQQRLLNYNCKTDVEEQQAIREITQEVVLAALGRGDFFKHALFQGGTCLRIFYGLNRFSEDMDFILREATPDFQLKDHIKHLTDELAAYGYNIQITDRDKADATVKKAFLKDDSLGKVIDLRHVNQAGPMAIIRIKLEVDTNPPSGSGHELKYLDFPFVSSVAVQDRPSLFAGKIHALLCREYIKGRDWYDFIWYTGNRTGINYDFLTSAINQLGPWQGQSITVDKVWLLNELERKITSMNWKQAAEDVRRFVRVAEQPSLDLWSKDLFLGQLDKLK